MSVHLLKQAGHFEHCTAPFIPQLFDFRFLLVQWLWINEAKCSERG